MRYPNDRRRDIKKTAYFGMYTALALIFGYVESLVPISVGIPGAKLGLANLITVFALYHMGKREALLLSMVRIVLSGLMFGNLFAILYSLAGGLVSFGCMVCLKHFRGFSMVGVSIGGGVAHNIGQLLMAVLVLRSIQIIHYLPVLMLAGLISGWLIGIVAKEVLGRILKWQEGEEA